MPQTNNQPGPVLDYASPDTVPFAVEHTPDGIMIWIPPERGWRLVPHACELVVCGGLVIYLVAVSAAFAVHSFAEPAAKVFLCTAFGSVAAACGLRIGTIITALRLPTGIGTDEGALVVVMPSWRGRRTRRWPAPALRHLRIRGVLPMATRTLWLSRPFRRDVRILEHRRSYELHWIVTQLLLAAGTQDTGKAQ